jgi:tRNA modification GTPase
LNKSDLEGIISRDNIPTLCKDNIINISAKTNQGIDVFENTVKEMFFGGEIDFNNEVFITNARQKNDIRLAYNSILLVKQSIEDEMPEDFYSIDLMNCYEALGRVIGEAMDDDLVNNIFSKFCMGK